MNRQTSMGEDLKWNKNFIVEVYESLGHVKYIWHHYQAMPSKQRYPTLRTQHHQWVVNDFSCFNLGQQDPIIFSQFITNFILLAWYGFQTFDNLFKISLIVSFVFAYFLTEYFGGGSSPEK